MAVVAAQELLEDKAELPSIRQISKRLGVSHVALYRHFDSLSSLLGEVAELELEGLIRQLARKKSLSGLITGYLTYATDQPAKYDLIMSHSNDTIMSWEKIGSLLTMLSSTCARMGLTKASDIQLLWMTLHGAVHLYRQRMIPARSVSQLASWVQRAVLGMRGVDSDAHDSSQRKCR